MATNMNIVWITLDSVRQDHTSMHGYRRNTTPRLQGIAEKPNGQAFNNCISHSKSTLPSSGAILTGTSPSHNTIGITGETVPDKLPTVAELLSNAGYRTACVSRNGFISSATDLDRGFDFFKWIAAETILQLNPKILFSYLWNIRQHSAGLTTNTAKHATPFLMNRVAKNWLRSFERENDPFFFYLHFNEPHRPYYPPLPYLDRYLSDVDISPSEAGKRSMQLHHEQKKRIAQRDFNSRDLQILQALYDAEITYTDNMVGRLFDFVQTLDIGETVFVVTADHGELFGEQDLLGHNLSLHDGLINVPLVTHCFNIPGHSGKLVQHKDIMRTLLERANADTETLSGINLESESRDYAFAQREPGQFDMYLRYNSDFDTERYHEPMLTAVRSANHKCLVSDQRSDLYLLPDEETEVSAEYPDVADRLSLIVEEFLRAEAKPVTEGSGGDFSDAMERQLRSLGYMS